MPLSAKRRRRRRHTRDDRKGAVPRFLGTNCRTDRGEWPRRRPQVGHTCSTSSLMNCNLLPPPALSQSSSAAVQNGVISREAVHFDEQLLNRSITPPDPSTLGRTQALS